MSQMAGIVVGDLARLSRGWALAQAEALKKDAHVQDPLTKGFRARFVGGAAEDEVILVHGRAAARSVGEDRVHIGWEGIEVAPGEDLCGFEIAGVPGEPPAAALLRGHNNLHAV